MSPVAFILRTPLLMQRVGVGVGVGVSAGARCALASTATASSSRAPSAPSLPSATAVLAQTAYRKSPGPSSSKTAATTTSAPRGRTKGFKPAGPRGRERGSAANMKTEKENKKKKKQAAEKVKCVVTDWVPLQMAIDSIRERATPPFANLIVDFHVNVKPSTPPLDTIVHLPHFHAGGAEPLPAVNIGAIVSNCGPEMKKRLTEKGATKIFATEESVAALASAEPNDDGSDTALDILLCQTEAFPLAVKYARNLGLKKIMPSARRGTVTGDIEDAIERSRRSAKMQYFESKGLVRMRVGGIGMSDIEIRENIEAMVRELLKLCALTQGKAPKPEEFLTKGYLSMDDVGKIPIGVGGILDALAEDTFGFT